MKSYLDKIFEDQMFNSLSYIKPDFWDTVDFDAPRQDGGAACAAKSMVRYMAMELGCKPQEIKQKMLDHFKEKCGGITH